MLKQTDFALTFIDDIKIEKPKRKKLFLKKQPYSIDKRYIVKKRPLWVRTFISLLQQPNPSQQAHLLIAAVDISAEIKKQAKLKIAEKKLRKQIDYDNLTCLKSRIAIENEIQQAFNDFQKTQKKATLIFLDVDNFKKINDEYGHQCGDEVLKQIANFLEQKIRASDEAARIGGDEFIILLREENNADLKSILKRLSIPLTVKYVSSSIKVTLSLGVYLLDKKVSSAKEWLKFADLAMYKNKKLK